MAEVKKALLSEKLEKVSLRRVIALFRPYRLLSVCIVMIALVASLMSLVPPLLMKSIIDNAIPDKSTELLLALGGWLLLITLLSALLDVMQNHLENIVGQNIMRDLRIHVYRNILRQSMSFFTQIRSGEIMQRLTNDIQMVQSVVTRSVVTAITQTTIWVTSVVIIMILDYKLAILALLVLPLYILPSRKTAKIRKRILSESQKIKSDISSQIAETTGISGALLTRIYCREHFQEEKFTKLNEIAMGFDLKLNLLGRWLTMFNGLLPSIGTI